MRLLENDGLTRCLVRSVGEVRVGLLEMRLPARVRGSGLRTKSIRPGPHRGVARER
jgi:hypothetical protein